METFRFYFDRRRYWLDVYLHPVTPDTFQRRGGGRWAWFQANSEPGKTGAFGELHFVASRIRHDVIAHEMFHVICEWMRFRGVELSSRNEERMATLFDELIRNFYKEYKKAK